MAKFRKKPVEIDAFQWTGGPDQTEDPEWAVAAIKSGAIRISMSGSPLVALYVMTREGEMRADPGDWIIRGVEGEIYPCKPSIFAKSYDPAVTDD